MVTRGMACRPPFPVFAVRPVPVLLNQNSIVNVLALSPGAGPMLA